jgi:hypothetical protein
VKVERTTVHDTSAVELEELNLLVALGEEGSLAEQQEDDLLGQCLNGDSPTHVVFGGFVQTGNVGSCESPTSLATKNLS